jgi:hypothetical protein
VISGIRPGSTYHCAAVRQTFVQAGAMSERPSRIHAIATNAMIAVIVAVVVLFNLPDGAITKTLSPVVNSIALPLGLDQSWALFAPVPPTRQDTLFVTVTMADGVVKAWQLPRANPVFGVPTQHRWRKVKETLITTPRTRPDFARWVVRRLTAADDRPVSVEMVLRTESLPPPGGDAPVDTGVQVLYREDFGAPR